MGALLALAGAVMRHRRVAIAVAVAAVFAAVYLMGAGAGADRVNARLERDAGRAAATSLSAERDVMGCHAAGGEWHVTTGTCEAPQ